MHFTQFYKKKCYFFVEKPTFKLDGDGLKEPNKTINCLSVERFI